MDDIFEDIEDALDTMEDILNNTKEYTIAGRGNARFEIEVLDFEEVIQLREYVLSIYSNIKLLKENSNE